MTAGMFGLSRISAALLVMTSVAAAEPFNEVTISLPVPSLADAEAWYTKLLGPDVEIARPVPSIVEFKVAPGVWLQLFEVAAQQPTSAIVRFSVDDFSATQSALLAAGINSGEAITIPDVVTYSEFADPYGNSLGLYALP